VGIPDYQTLMLPVLKLAAIGECRVPDIATKVADEFHLSAAEREELLSSGKQRVLHNRIHWAKFYMTKAGLIASPSRGRFTASEAGKELLATNPARIDVSVLMRIPKFKDFYQNEGADSVNEDQSTLVIQTQAVQGATPEEQIDLAQQVLISALRADLLDRIIANTPSFFERLIVDLLVAMGYGGSHKNAAAQLGRSGDGGVDGIINEDPLGLDRVYVQAKRYGTLNNVGRPEVQGFLGSLVGLGASKGVFVTTSSFSPQAREFVKHLPQRIVLIDGHALTDLLVEHGVGVRTFRTIDVKRLDEDFFLEDD
jgi:restriction system protein